MISTISIVILGAHAMQIKTLVSSDALRKACPAPFDEGLLWRSEGSEALAGKLQVGFAVPKSHASA